MVSMIYFRTGTLLLLSVLLSWSLAAPQVRFELNETTCEFRFYRVNDKQHEETLWLHSDGINATFDGIRVSTKDHTLALEYVEPKKADSDHLGKHNVYQFRWGTPTTAQPFQLVTFVKVYTQHDTVIFGQTWPVKAKRTNRQLATISSSFPSIKALDPGSVGLLSFNGRFMQTSRAFLFATGDAGSVGGERGGPVVLFDESMSQTLAIAPLSHAMAMGVHFDQERVSTGLLGTIESVPADFTIETVVSFNAGKGITSETRNLGQKMLRYFKTKEARRKSLEGDISLSSIGYITDNGAYYYYLTEKNETYEETLLQVYEDSISRGIPIRYIQLDSWWYQRGAYGGVKNWTEMSHVFPNGLKSFSQKTGWPLFLHNRYWAPDNVYSDDYNFIIEDTFAIPTEQRFWNDLMKNASHSGMTIYEQDWLYNEFENLNATLKSATLGTRWLQQMGHAASLYDITIQYCMPLPRMVLEAARIPSVSQVRAGDDYHPNNTYNCEFPFCLYYIHTTSILLWSLDLMPSKDVFWTSAHQPETKYKPPGSVEPHSEMLALVSIMSRGPVHFGDKVGYTDRSIVALTSTVDGTLLRPSRPATAIDSCFAAAAFPKTSRRDVLSVKGEAICGIMSTHTKIGEYMFAHVFAILLPNSASIEPDDIPLDVNDGEHLVYTGYGKPDNVTVLGLFSNRHPLTLPPSGASDFALFHTSPILGNHSVVLLGEMEKFVPVSKDRLETISFEGDHLVVVSVKGFPGEIVTLSFVRRRKTSEVFQVQCTVTADGTVEMDSDGNCGGVVKTMVQ